MSVKILRELVTEQQVTLIRQMLNIKPIEKKIYNQNKHFMPEIEKTPIQFYQVKEDPLSKQKCLYLPFQFANKLFGAICNYQIQYPTRNFKFTGKLRDYQEEDTKQALEHLSQFCSTTLNFSTGAGKTICSANLATRIQPQLLTLVIIHLQTLIKQWEKTFQEHTTAKIWVVGEMEQPEFFDVIICMEQRISHIDPKILATVGFLFLDEVDRLMTPSRINPLLATQPKYVIGMTATLDMRTDGMDVMIHCLLGTHKIVRVIEKQMWLYKLKTNYVPPIERTSRGTNWSVIVRWLAENEDRNNQIIKFILRHYENHKILVLCNLIEHTQTLYNKLEYIKSEVEKLKNINLANEYSKLNSEKLTFDYYSGSKKKYKDSRILIGGIKKLAVGFDDASSSDAKIIERINMLIIISSFKDESLLTQVLGRIRADNPIVIYFVDNNNTIKTHFRASKQFVESRNGHIINVDEKELDNICIPKLEEEVIDIPEEKNEEENKNDEDHKVEENKNNKIIIKIKN